MSHTVFMFSLVLACGHSKTVKREVDRDAPRVGAIVNCLGCAREGDTRQLVVTRVADVELLSAGLE